MTKSSKIRMPGSHTAPYKAAEHLFKNGPATEMQLFNAVDMGLVPSRREEKLSCAITSGLLSQLPDGRIDCSAEARAHFSEKFGTKSSENTVGQIAPTLPQYRGDWRASSGLSRHNIPNRRGTRSDIPDWSKRETVAFHTKA